MKLKSILNFNLRQRIKDDYMLFIFESNADLKNMRNESSRFDRFYYIIGMRMVQMLVSIMLVILILILLSSTSFHWIWWIDFILRIVLGILLYYTFKAFFRIITRILLKRFKR